MRLTYGTVQDYYPADAVHYDYRTTLLGVMEKEDPQNFEFIVPDKLKELYEKKDTASMEKMNHVCLFPHQSRHHRRQFRQSGHQLPGAN
jgi:hypothetical protein